MEDSKWYLGKIDWVGHRGPHLTGSFCPLYEQAADARSWERELDEASRAELFPNQGRVSWWAPGNDVKRGEFYHFTIEDQPTYESENPKHDRFRVREAKRASQYLDFSAISLEEARVLLTQDGISLPDETIREYCIMLCGNLWSEGLGFVQLPDTRLWIIDPTKSRDPLRWHECNCEDRFLLNLGKKKIPGANVKLQGRMKLLDWCPDAILLDRVMRRLRTLDRAFSDSLQLSAGALTKLAEIHATNAVKGNLDLENARIERMRLLLERVKSHADAAGIVSKLLETEPLRQELDQNKQQILDDERTIAKKQAQEEVEIERRKVDLLKHEQSSLKAEIERLQSAQETLLHGFEASLGARLKEVAKAPEKFLAELSLLKAALETLSPKGDMPTKKAGPAQCAEQNPSLPAEALISSVGELEKRLEAAFGRSSVSPSLIRPLHASLLAGVVPVFTGARAFEACGAYARCVTAGHLHWLPVSPAWVEPAQLFGESSVSEPTGLHTFLRRARTSEQMQLVLLDGINRAPVDSYLMPLLCCYRDAWLTGGARSLSIRSDSAPLFWPRNVLLAATLSEGMVSIPPPAGLWGFCTLIHGSLLNGAAPSIERIEHPDKVSSDAARDIDYAVTVSQWATWRTTCVAQDLEPCVKLWSKFALEFGFRPESRDLCLRFFAALRILNADVARAIGETIAHCLFSQMIHDQEKALERLTGIPLPYKDIGSALSVTANLIG